MSSAAADIPCPGSNPDEREATCGEARRVGLPGLRPYYQRGGIALYHGNALEILAGMPADFADALVTDPPYSSGGFTRSDRAVDPVVKYQQHGIGLARSSFSGDNRDARSWALWCSLWLHEMLRILRPAGYGLMFADWRQLPLATDAFQCGGFVWRGLIPWDKTEAARPPHTGYFRHQAEYVVWGTKGAAKKAPGRGPWAGAFRFPVRQSDKFHLTRKPTALMVELVQCAAPGGVVVDPFCGSGTTLLACGLTGRRAVGIELEEAHCEVAAKRLEEFAAGNSALPGGKAA